MGSGAQSARLYRQDKIGTDDDMRDVMVWRGTAGRGQLLLLQREGNIYRRDVGEATTLGKKRLAVRFSQVPKATPVSLFLL